MQAGEKVRGIGLHGGIMLGMRRMAKRACGACNPLHAGVPFREHRYSRVPFPLVVSTLGARAPRSLARALLL